ncbi:MAG TPA: hypothetical protein VF520_06545 [Thermoleophilaceae bacterium]
MIAVVALAIAATILYLGRRDVTRPAVAFGVVWFGCVALAQLRLTENERPWPDGYWALVLAGGLVFVLAAVLAGGTAPARGAIVARREDYSPRRLVVAALVLSAGALAGLAYKADVLGGVPLLSGHADLLRSRAYRGGEVAIPAWSTALTDGFFLAMWCTLAALWTMRGATRARRAATWALAAGALFGVALLASRNSVLFALSVPLAAAYLLTRLGTRTARAGWVGVGIAVFAAVVGGLFVVRVSENPSPQESFLEREVDRQPPALKLLVPFYVNAVYPLEAEARLYSVVPDRRPYALGAASLLSLPDAAFPEGKPNFGLTLAELMRERRGDGLSWSVATYQGRLYGDGGWAMVLLGSALLGLGLGMLYRWARARSGLVPVAVVGFVAYYAAYMTYDNLLSFTVIAVYDLAAIAAIDLYVRGELDEPLAAIAGVARRVGSTG